MPDPRDVPPSTHLLPPEGPGSTLEVDFPLHLTGVRRPEPATETYAPPKLPVGSTPEIPGYEILREVGRGGMGVVFLARQTTLNRQVALKMILEGGFASAEDRVRFLAEAEAIAQLHHPHIVQVHEFNGTTEGNPYFSMEYVEGGSLEDLLHNQPQPPREAAALTAQLADAVQAAHDKNIIHRDLKPANILLAQKSPTTKGKSPTKTNDQKYQEASVGTSDLGFVGDLSFGICDFTPKITDFGLAKRMGTGTGPTTTGTIVGTPSYMAPEQAGGKGLVGPAADVYSLGAILYELLTGRPPFKGLNAMETAMQVLTAEPVPPHRLVPTVPRDLETICLKCLHKDSKRRYESAAALEADLQRFLEGQPILARPVGRLERLTKWAKRRPAVAGLTAALAVVLIGSIAALSWLYLDAEQQRQEAVQARENARAAEAKAKEAEQHARQSAAKAEAINRFFIDDFLANILPEKARNRTITLEEVLSRAANRIGEVFAEQPELEFQMRSIVGRAYTSLGRYADALPHLERAVRLGQQLYGTDHNRTLVARANLVSLRERMGKDTPDVKEQRELLAKREAEYGPDHTETLTAMNNLASMMSRQGKTQEAEILYRTVLERASRVHGPHHQLTLSTQNNLGFLLYRLDRAQEAEPLLRAAVTGLRKVLGVEHTTTITTESNWALALLALGRVKEAEEIFRRILETRQRVLGPEHPDTLTALNNVAGVLYKQKHFAEAEKLFRQVLEVRQRVHGADHTDTLSTLDNLSQAVFNQKKHNEAVPLLRELYDQYRRKYGQTHTQTQRVFANLASEMANAGRHLEAEALFRQLYSFRKESLGPEHPDTLTALMQQGYCRLQAGSPSEAEPLLKQCVEARRRVLGEVHADTQTAILQWVRALTSLGRASEAETLLLETQRFIEQNGKVSKAQRRELLEKLIQYYDEAGRPDQAEPWRKKLAALQPT